MTVSTTTSSVGPYACNGSTSEFPVTFPFLENDDLVVYLIDSTGTSTTLTIDTHYTVTGAGGASGTVTTVATYASGNTILIDRVVDLLQETDLENQATYYPEVLEDALDKLTMVAQQLYSGVSRSIKFPTSDSPITDPVLPARADRLGKFLIFDAVTGQPTVVESTVTVGTYDGMSFATIAALRLAGSSFTDGTVAIVAGYAVPGDGGGGPLRVWQTSGAPYTDDGGSVIVPTSGDGSGAWVFENADGFGEVDVRWFGAVDGADSTSALLSAFAYANASNVGIFIPGEYLTTTALPLSRSGMTVRGLNRTVSIIQSSDSAGIYNGAGSSKNHITIRDLKVKTTAVGAKSLDMSLFSYSQIENCTFEVAGNDSTAVYLAGTAAGSSSYYNTFINNYLAATGGATGCIGYFFDAYISGSLVRGSNSNVITGGRISSMLKSVDMQAGNNNKITVWSEAPTGAGSHFNVGLTTVMYTGTATSGTTNTIVDSGASFPSTLASGGVRIISGTGAGQARKILSATSTAITTVYRWATVPDNTSVYEAFPATIFDCCFDSCRLEGGASANAVTVGLSCHSLTMQGGHATSYGGVLLNQDTYNSGNRYVNFGGYRGDLAQFSFYYDNVTAALTNADLLYLGTSTSVLLHDNFDIVGIAARTSGARSAGTLTVNPKINGVVRTGINVIIDATVKQANVQFFKEGTENAEGGSRYLGAVVTTSADWAPTTADLVVTFFVKWRT
jgi:hypothetical protein